MNTINLIEMSQIKGIMWIVKAKLAALSGAGFASLEDHVYVHHIPFFMLNCLLKMIAFQLEFCPQN